MRIPLDLNKSLEANASGYYEKAKKARKKTAGAKAALERTLKRLEEVKAKKEIDSGDEIKESKKEERKREWYEKFRWFITSTGFLAIGGRDATTNEIVIKKHTEPNDLVLHTDMAGSPFFVIKTEGKEADKKTIEEVADATCSFSRAWKLGLSSQQVFYVKPEQVSKAAKAGENLPKGAFMIYGKTSYADNKINCAIGIMEDGRIMAGPVEAVKKHCEKYAELKQGERKPSDIAKEIKRKIGGEIDEIIRAMPSGGMEIKK